MNPTKRYVFHHLSHTYYLFRVHPGLAVTILTRMFLSPKNSTDKQPGHTLTLSIYTSAVGQAARVCQPKCLGDQVLPWPSWCMPAPLIHHIPLAGPESLDTTVGTSAWCWAWEHLIISNQPTMTFTSLDWCVNACIFLVCVCLWVCPIIIWDCKCFCHVARCDDVLCQSVHYHCLTSTVWGTV